jgi:ABC-type sugar transport system substrate-binding protein
VRKVLTALAVATALLPLAACGGSSQSGATSGGSPATKQLRIGFSPFTLDAPALQGLNHGLEEYAKAKGYAVQVADPKGDPAKQVEQLQGWVTRKQVDAIWIIPTNPGALKTVIKSAQDAGIAVLASGKPDDYGQAGPGAGLSFNIFDYTETGTKTGELLSECVNKRLGGNAEVVFAQDPPTSGAGSVESANAMKAALSKGSPNARIVSEVNHQNDRLKAQQAVSAALQANRNANALLGQNDEGSLGGMTAFKQAGKDVKTACIVGFGGGQSAQDAVKAGDLYGVVAINFHNDLVQNVDLLAKMAGDPKATGQVTKPPVDVVKAPGA